METEFIEDQVCSACHEVSESTNVVMLSPGCYSYDCKVCGENNIYFSDGK